MEEKETQILKFFKSIIGQTMPVQAPPFTRWLNGVIHSAENGNFRIEFEVRKEMTNPLGLLHGGVQAAILDDVIGMTVAALDKPNPAVSINLNFLGKAYEGDKVMAVSNVVRKGKQIIYITGELIHPEDKKIIAKCTSNMLQISQS